MLERQRSTHMVVSYVDKPNSENDQAAVQKQPSKRPNYSILLRLSRTQPSAPCSRFRLVGSLCSCGVFGAWRWVLAPLPSARIAPATESVGVLASVLRPAAAADLAHQVGAEAGYRVLGCRGFEKSLENFTTSSINSGWSKQDQAYHVFKDSKCQS